jgi:hypothetical protein
MGDEFPELGLLELLSHAQFRVTSRVAAALRERRSSLEEWRVLSLLADGEGHAMSEIAEFMLMPPPSTTKLIDRSCRPTWCTAGWIRPTGGGCWSSSRPVAAPRTAGCAPRSRR